MSDRVYLYNTKDVEGKKISLPEAMESEAKQALDRYTVSKTYVDAQCTYLWRNGEKRYRLDTQDRAANKKLKNWQSNITAGLSRTFIDIFQSSLAESPISPVGAPIGDVEPETVDNILMALAFVADKSGFQNESKIVLKNGLKTGQFAIRVGYHNKQKVTTYLATVDGKIEERKLVRNSLSIPYAKNVEVWNIYPDPYRGLMRYNTERCVTSYSGMMDQFGSLINSPYNESPFKDPNFLKTLPINAHGNVDFTDRGSITNQIYQKKNSDAQVADSYIANNNSISKNNNANQATQDLDSKVTQDLIEILYYTSEEKIVIHANNYPVYIGKNIYGFVPYVIRSATDETMRLGVEGIPFLMQGIEETHDSFLNNLIDSARMTTTPLMQAQRGVFFDEQAVENAGPGDILWVETPALNGASPISRIDKGSSTDNGLIDTMQSLGNQKTGISEYNMGISAKERTATGANATVNSDKKRLTPYLASFSTCVGEIFEMWFSMMMQNWTTEQYVSVTGKNGEKTGKMLSNKDIAADMVLSLDLDGLMLARNDVQIKRLIEFFPQLAGSQLIDNPGEVMAEILRGLGLNPARYNIKYNTPAVTTTTPETPVDTTEQTDTQFIADELAKANNPQLDLGNNSS